MVDGSNGSMESAFEGASARPVRLTNDELERLAEDPRNRVFRQETTETHEPWKVDTLEPIFRAAHATFVIMASTHPERTDDDLRKEMIRDANEKMAEAIRDHPMIFAKLTTRRIATDPQKMRALWMMFAMHRMIQSGEVAESEAQKAFAQTVLPVCLSQPPVD